MKDVSPAKRPAGKSLLRVLAGEPVFPPPIWIMRQAGRYLPEYRALRAQTPSFLDFCYAPKIAAEATMQPIRRYGFDAAILFSDILVVPDALGQNVRFEAGEGPRLDPVEDEAGFGRLHEAIDLGRLAPVFETIGRLRGLLPTETTLIGFCGAPFTVASYMVAGRGTPDQGPARLMAYRDPTLFQRLIDRLTEASIAYLHAQIDAGVEAIQIFDTWAGALAPGEYERWCLEPIRAVAAAVSPRAPVIGFPKGIGARLAHFGEKAGVQGVGLDSGVDPVWAAAALPRGQATQGNLDPLALIAGGDALERAARRILEAFHGRPHIFNLGHGVTPQTPPEHVGALVELVRRGGA
ncbi:uroporphyrinogen decarboxylase [Methylocella sp.]|uniref:uroporphyrinogen decarboxylase n=1 Tax=Methylocella sp. TaxID=1978226 RepID=UPI0037835401